jgi:FtsH-binding integral membrane protein
MGRVVIRPGLLIRSRFARNLVFLAGLALYVAGFPCWAWSLPWLSQPLFFQVLDICLTVGLMWVGLYLVVIAMRAAIKSRRLRVEVNGPPGRDGREGRE